KFGIKTYFGDATRPDLLKAAGLDRAKIIVIAIDERESINTIVRHVVEYFPQVHIVARARDRHHVYELWSLGCRDIIRETYDSSLRMGRSTFEALGYSREVAEEMVQAFNDSDRETMIEVADVFDVNIPAAENPAYIEKVRTLLEERGNELGESMRLIRDKARDKAG
ncbi:MAG: NAD-binding protein, partial [Pseudomonadota bacterium]